MVPLPTEGEKEKEGVWKIRKEVSKKDHRPGRLMRGQPTLKLRNKPSLQVYKSTNIFHLSQIHMFVGSLRTANHFTSQTSEKKKEI